MFRGKQLKDVKSPDPELFDLFTLKCTRLVCLNTNIKRLWQIKNTEFILAFLKLDVNLRSVLSSRELVEEFFI